MPSNLNIDDTLLQKALIAGGQKTKRETVNEALAEYIQRRQQKQILSLFGKIDFEPKYNYKKLRKRH